MNPRTKNRLIREAELQELMKVMAVIAERQLNDTPGMTSPEDVAALLMADMSERDQEELWVVLLDTRSRVMRVEHLYKGSLNTSMIRMGELFKAAIRENAAAIILAHNHPSGDPSPSPEDIALTRAAVQAGNLLDVNVLDHLIIGRGLYTSLKSKGLGF